MHCNEKQLQILATSERLFAKNGYEGTSVRDIAEEAGVNIAMISYYFGSKEKMMEALFEQRTQYVKLKVETLLNDETLSPLQKMEVLVDEHIEKIIDKQQFYKIMICEQVINKNPIIIDLIYDMKKKNIEEISKLIEFGQQKKVFNANIDVLLLMNTMTGCITQMMIGLEHYKTFNKLSKLKPESSNIIIKQKLSDHIKFLFKSLLTHEP